jgi:hypothetical protein
MACQYTLTFHTHHFSYQFYSEYDMMCCIIGKSTNLGFLLHDISQGTQWQQGQIEVLPIVLPRQVWTPE